MTLQAVIPGILFGIIFGAANAYLGLQSDGFRVGGGGGITITITNGSLDHETNL